MSDIKVTQAEIDLLLNSADVQCARSSASARW